MQFSITETEACSIDTYFKFADQLMISSIFLEDWDSDVMIKSRVVFRAHYSELSRQKYLVAPFESLGVVSVSENSEYGVSTE